MAGFAEYTVAAAAWAGLFLLVFAMRMRTEFRGENLSDAAAGVRKTTAKTRANTGVSPLRAVRSGRDDESRGVAGCRWELRLRRRRRSRESLRWRVGRGFGL